MKYKIFFKAALNRAIRTIAQTAVAVIGTSYVISDVDWSVVVSASILAGVLSILTSIATNLPEVEYENAFDIAAAEDEDILYIEDSDEIDEVDE